MSMPRAAPRAATRPMTSTSTATPSLKKKMARVQHTSLVAPSPAGPEDDLHERSLPLTYLDAMWLQARPCSVCSSTQGCTRNFEAPVLNLK